MTDDNAPLVTLRCVADPEVPPFPGRLQGWEESGLVRVTVPFEVADRAKLRLDTKDRFTATGYVVYCVPWLSGYRLAIQLQDGRRAEVRLPADQAALISVYGTRPTERTTGRVVDISRSGMGLRLRQQLPVGSLVKVETEAAIIFGEIRHCARIPDEDGLFKVGIRIAATGARASAPGPLASVRQWLWDLLRGAAGNGKRDASA